MENMDELIQQSESTAIFAVGILIFGIFILGLLAMKIFGLYRNSQQALDSWKMDWEKEVLEKKAQQDRIQKLEGWTQRQQKDLQTLVKAITVLMIAMQAVLKYVIGQGANGECKKALDCINEYIEEKMNQTESHT